VTRHPWTDTIRQHRRASDALARAVQRPSLWERSPGAVMQPDECVRCFRRLDPDRSSIFRDCWKD
jgi:hypothetical protein